VAISIYFFSVVCFAVLVHIIDIFFTAALVRSLGVTPEPGVGNVAYYRYSARAMWGAYPLTSRFLRVSCWILRISSVVLFACFCGALYIAFANVGGGACAECRLDPADKSVTFWMAYASAVLLLSAGHVGDAAVSRWDPRMRETGASFDARRVKFAARIIFTDRIALGDRLARGLRDTCRWLIVLGVLALIAALGAAYVGL
jgi:hypothetical protein